MLDFKNLQSDIASLPEDAQQLILDFVGLLQRYQSHPAPPHQPISFTDQPFVGMWSDVPEMQDSTAWIRQTRQNLQRY
ncbi:MAG: DUF2281 domain-containing protein [Cyanobacteria bacterium P01_A01_bin.114]